jgi:U3 small nucleolar RNA-associated protein 15
MLSTEMYTPVLRQSPTIDSLFLRLRRKLVAELRLQNDLVRTKGALDMLFTFAALSV